MYHAQANLCPNLDETGQKIKGNWKSLSSPARPASGSQDETISRDVPACLGKNQVPGSASLPSAPVLMLQDHRTEC
jgi:hypothetical protein